MKGIPPGSPLSHDTSTLYSAPKEASRPITRPPMNVSGRLEKYPIAAAPNAWTTSRVMTVASRPRLGEMSSPATVANTVPMIHAQRLTLVGFSPLRSTSSGTSTMPRIAMPSRKVRKKIYKPMAPTIATTKTMT